MTEAQTEQKRVLLGEGLFTPTEPGVDGQIIATVDDLAALPDFQLSAEEVQKIAALGNNKGCMSLKGGNPEHEGESLPDRWELTAELESVAARWGIDPRTDLLCTHAKHS